jgi:hypothetical protein
MQVSITFHLLRSDEYQKSWSLFGTATEQTPTETDIGGCEGLPSQEMYMSRRGGVLADAHG